MGEMQYMGAGPEGGMRRLGIENHMMFPLFAAL
jgi:hypothetical protein